MTPREQQQACNTCLEHSGVTATLEFFKEKLAGIHSMVFAGTCGIIGTGLAVIGFLFCKLMHWA